MKKKWRYLRGLQPIVMNILNSKWLLVFWTSFTICTIVLFTQKFLLKNIFFNKYRIDLWTPKLISNTVQFTGKKWNVESYKYVSQFFKRKYKKLIRTSFLLVLRFFLYFQFYWQIRNIDTNRLFYVVQKLCERVDSKWNAKPSRVKNGVAFISRANKRMQNIF